MRCFVTGHKRAKFKRSSILTAYYANVRSVLEYGSIIWTGAAKSHTVRVDRVQHKFLMWLLTSSPSGFTSSLSYQNLLSHFKVPSLASRRIQHDLIFVRNIFHSKLDSQTLQSSFSLHIPARSTRTQKLFSEPWARVSTVQSGMFCRIPRLMNLFLSKNCTVDVFSDSLYSFKRSVIRYVRTL